MNKANWIAVMSPFHKHNIQVHLGFAKSVKVHPVYLHVLANQLLARLGPSDWYGEVYGDVAAQTINDCEIKTPFRYHLGFFKDGTLRVYGPDIPKEEEVRDLLVEEFNVA